MSISRFCPSPRVLAIAAAIALAALPGTEPRPAHAAAYLVTTLADSGPGSLRQAILDANATPGADTITFGVSGTITLASSLPDITDPAGLTIDGTGQAVAVSGNNLVRPLRIAKTGSAGLRHLTITNGLAPFGDAYGGGVRNQGVLTLDGVSVTNNNSGIVGCFGSGCIRGDGGGIYSEGGLEIRATVFEGNSGGHGGGLAVASPGFASVTGSLFVNNIATGLSSGGGAISVGAAGIIVDNSTLAGNQLTEPGGFGNTLYNSGSFVRLVNSTVAGNGLCSPATCWPQTAFFTNGFGVTQVSNSIVSNNPRIECETIEALGPNVIPTLAGCSFLGTPPINADPLLGPLADNGGPTFTHALLPGSPAIDAGDDAICVAAPVSGVDQRGVKRPQGAHCDLGAYERQAGVPLLNGDFEAGTTGWTLSGLTDGIARVETQGSCFGANNTLGISFAGDRALNVRSSPGAPAGSTGIATSSAFTLGASLSFRALVENDDAVPAPDPVAFEVRILDEVGGVRATHGVKPSILTTSPGTSNDGCLVGDLRDGPWSTHTIDTSAFAGQTGRVEFRQHTNVLGKGFFALVDDVMVQP